MGRFEGQCALVTGGARGIGAACVEGLAREGARVLAADVLRDEGEQLAERLGDAVEFAHLDVTSEEDWIRAVGQAEDWSGPIDHLVNNAGILGYGTVEDIEPAAFRHIIDVNLFGTFLGMHFVIPSMRRAGGGAIVNVSSTAGMMGYAQIGAYVASKWGVRGLTKSAALETGRDGIRVMSVHPGPIATPMTDGLGGEVTSSQPIPRFGTTDEVAKLVAYLLADATFSTGSEFVVDGGALLGPVVDLSGLAEA